MIKENKVNINYHGLRNKGVRNLTLASERHGYVKISRKVCFPRLCEESVPLVSEVKTAYAQVSLKDNLGTQF